MAGPFQREPGDPTGSRPLDIWLRALKRWIRGLELKSGPGYRKIPSPDGGFTLDILPVSGGNGDPFPFDLYQGSTWLKWKVRSGYVVQTGAPWIPDLVDTEFTLSSGVAHNYFWLDVDAQTIAVSGLTTWSPKKILLGWVDTQTNAASNQAVPYNLRKFIFTPCG